MITKFTLPVRCPSSVMEIPWNGNWFAETFWDIRKVLSEETVSWSFQQILGKWESETKKPHPKPYQTKWKSCKIEENRAWGCYSEKNTNKELKENAKRLCDDRGKWNWNWNRESHWL